MCLCNLAQTMLCDAKLTELPKVTTHCTPFQTPEKKLPTAPQKLCKPGREVEEKIRIQEKTPSTVAGLSRSKMSLMGSNTFRTSVVRCVLLELEDCRVARTCST